MSSNIGSEKVFEKYADFPTDIRNVVINEMEADDRCRFTRSSWLCNEEAKASKHYIHTVQFKIISPKFIRVVVFYGKYQSVKGKAHMTSWVFEERKDKLKYFTQNDKFDKELWEEKLDNAKSIAEHAEEFFENMLIRHQRQIKVLNIGGLYRISVTNLFSNLHKKITAMSSLEELDVDESMDILPMLPVIFKSKPLEDLSISDKKASESLGDFEQIYQIKGWVCLPHLKLNNQQFLRFSGVNVTIHIGQLTENDIYNFIKSWQDGTIGKSVTSYQWKLDNSNFDAKLVFRLLGDNSVQHHPATKSCEIEHQYDPEKSASLILHHSNLEFRVEHKRPYSRSYRLDYFREG